MSIQSGLNRTSYSADNQNVTRLPPQSQTQGPSQRTSVPPVKPQGKLQSSQTTSAMQKKVPPQSTTGPAPQRSSQPTQNITQPVETITAPASELLVETSDDILQYEQPVRKQVVHKSQAPKKKKKDTQQKTKLQIRDFPLEVMDIVRGVVPGGNSYLESLLAYIYVTSPTKFPISDKIQAIVDNYYQDDEFAQVMREIRLLREQLRNIEITAYQTAIASEYTLFHNLGLRKDKETNPIDIDYLEPGVEDMHIALEESAKQMKKKDTIRHGRKF